MIEVAPETILLLAYWADGTLDSLSDRDLADLELTRSEAEALLGAVLAERDLDHQDSGLAE